MLKLSLSHPYVSPLVQLQFVMEFTEFILRYDREHCFAEGSICGQVWDSMGGILGSCTKCLGTWFHWCQQETKGPVQNNPIKSTTFHISRYDVLFKICILPIPIPPLVAWAKTSSLGPLDHITKFQLKFIVGTLDRWPISFTDREIKPINSKFHPDDSF